MRWLGSSRSMPTAVNRQELSAGTTKRESLVGRAVPHNTQATSAVSSFARVHAGQVQVELALLAGGDIAAGGASIGLGAAGGALVGTGAAADTMRNSTILPLSTPQAAAAVASDASNLRGGTPVNSSMDVASEASSFKAPASLSRSSPSVMVSGMSLTTAVFSLPHVALMRMLVCSTVEVKDEADFVH